MEDLIKSDLGSNESSMDILDIGELTWNDRLRQKPKIQGKYLRGDILGQGAFARVYEVLDTKTLRRRAVKIFDLNKFERRFNRDELIKMINQEVSILSRCNHPNVIKMVHVYRSIPLVRNDDPSSEPETPKETKETEETKNTNDTKDSKDTEDTEETTEKERDPNQIKDKKEKDDSEAKEKSPTGHQHLRQLVDPRTIHKHPARKNKIWMYLEYCMASVSELMGLSDPSRTVALPLHQARHYFIGLLKGLEYLHSKGIYHKDIKPDNMLINVFNTIKITDLSVSHVVDTFNSSDICNNTFGTIPYQPPEVISSPDSGFSASASDIWSSGVTLYVMVNCKLPFLYNNSVVSLTDSIQNDEPEKSPLMNDNPCLSKIIDCMLTKDPAKRIKIDQLLKHPWLRMHLPDDTPYIKIPPRYSYGDQYRSLTITAYLHELHYPLPSQHNTVTVSETSASEFSVKQKIPILRSNRSPTRTKLRRKKRRSSLIVRHLQSNQCLKRLLGAIGIKNESNVDQSMVYSSRSSIQSSESNYSNNSMF